MHEKFTSFVADPLVFRLAQTKLSTLKTTHCTHSQIIFHPNSLSPGRIFIEEVLGPHLPFNARMFIPYTSLAHIRSCVDTAIYFTGRPMYHALCSLVCDFYLLNPSMSNLGTISIAPDILTPGSPTYRYLCRLRISVIGILGRPYSARSPRFKVITWPMPDMPFQPPPTLRSVQVDWPQRVSPESSRLRAISPPTQESSSTT